MTQDSCHTTRQQDGEAQDTNVHKLPRCRSSALSVLRTRSLHGATSASPLRRPDQARETGSAKSISRELKGDKVFPLRSAFAVLQGKMGRQGAAAGPAARARRIASAGSSTHPSLARWLPIVAMLPQRTYRTRSPRNGQVSLASGEKERNHTGVASSVEDVRPHCCSTRPGPDHEGVLERCSNSWSIFRCARLPVTAVCAR